MQIDIPVSKDPRVLVIGAGFGGLEVAKALCKMSVQVVLIDKNNYHTFQPLLYQVATSALEADSIAFPIRKIFKGYSNFFFRLAEVQSVDAEKKVVFTDIGDLSFDYLVIATGSQTNYFGMEGLILRSMPMKTILEALDLRSLILQNFEQALGIQNKRKKESYTNFVIAGAGPTGVELAGALGELKQHILPKDYPELDLTKMKIYLIQSGDRVLPALSPKSSERAKKYLEDLGVDVVLGTRVVDYFGDYVQTNTGHDFTARTLIWTTGVVGVPIDGISKESINRGKRILVNSYNEVVGHKDIFAIGDIASMEVEDSPRGHPMVAPVAMQQGQLLAKNLRAIIQGQKPVPFKYVDKGAMATVGKNKAVVEMGKLKIGGAMAWYIWMLVHLFSLAGFRNKVIVFFNWIRSYINSDKGVRLILKKYDRSKVKQKRMKELKENESDS